MSLVAKMKQFGHGAASIAEWLGDGGDVVEDHVAQERCNICLECTRHDETKSSKHLIAEKIRRVLEIKNKIGLHVEREDELGDCDVCGCVLKLQIWEPDALVTKQSEKERFPPNCWKIQS